MQEPKIDISQQVPLTAEFRAQMTKWMGDFFGWRSRDPIIDIENGIIFCSPTTYQQLKRTLSHEKTI
jgi:hypothetical protein